MARKRRYKSSNSISIKLTSPKKLFTRRSKKQLKYFIILIVAVYLIDYISKNGLPNEAIILGIILVIIVAAFYGFRQYNRNQRKGKIKASGIDDIDKMSGEEFEIFLEMFFSNRDCSVQRTALSGDYGADIIIRKDGISTAVQAKRYNDKVGLTAVQEVVAAMSHYKCSKGMVVTNNYFTPQALTLADSNNIELWDRDKLIHEILIKKHQLTKENNRV